MSHLEESLRQTPQGWPGNALVFRRTRWAGRERSGVLCLGCYPGEADGWLSQSILVSLSEFVAWVSCSQLTEVALVFCFCSPSASRFSVNHRNGLWGKSGGGGVEKDQPIWHQQPSVGHSEHVCTPGCLDISVNKLNRCTQ